MSFLDAVQMAAIKAELQSPVQNPEPASASYSSEEKPATSTSTWPETIDDNGTVNDESLVQAIR